MDVTENVAAPPAPPAPPAPNGGPQKILDAISSASSEPLGAHDTAAALRRARAEVETLKVRDIAARMVDEANERAAAAQRLLLPRSTP